MRVRCFGDGFAVTPLSATEQVLSRITRWQFDILAQCSGPHTLHLVVDLRLPWHDYPEACLTVDVRDQQILVMQSALSTVLAFWWHHWQWTLATFLGLAGAITTWLRLIDGWHL